MVTYSDDQKIAIDLINKFISQNENKKFYLFGYPGTGKTFLAASMVKKYIDLNDVNEINICSPTHKALNVIETYIRNIIGEDYFNSSECKIHFSTIHRKLSLKPYIVTENGSLSFKSSNKSVKITNITIIFIDECSMISSSMATNIDGYLTNDNIKIIYMGDDLQLPPVEEAHSVIFDEISPDYIYHVNMKKIIRTDSTHIQNACMAIRNWDKITSIYKILKPIHIAATDKSFRLIRLKTPNNEISMRWINHMIFEIENNKNPIILTWDNATANTYNNIIRKIIHKKRKLAPYEIGDHIMFNDYYSSSTKEMVFYTSDMAKITNIQYKNKQLCKWNKFLIKPSKKPIDKKFNTLLLKLNALNNKYTVNILNVNKKSKMGAYDISVIDDINVIVNTHDFSDLKNTIEYQIKLFYKRYRSKSLVDKLWKIYRDHYITPYANITFGYAITTYKSQGSTYDTVYIHMENLATIRNNDDLQKALCTSFGRARYELLLLV